MTDDAAARARIEAVLRAVPLACPHDHSADSDSPFCDMAEPDYPAMAEAVATFAASEVERQVENLRERLQAAHLEALRESGRAHGLDLDCDRLRARLVAKTGECDRLLEAASEAVTQKHCPSCRCQPV